MIKKVSLSDGRQLIIRDAVCSDAAAMHKLFNETSKESDNLPFGEGEFGKSVEDVEKHIEGCIKKDNAIYIVAEVDNEIIGYLSFEGGWRKRSRHVGEFGIAIRKAFWGLGIGSLLIQYLIDWAKQSKTITKINLTVVCDNTSAVKLYEKLGFKHEGRITRASIIDGVYRDIFYMGMQVD